MAAGLSPVLRYRGLYGSHQSTANLLLKMGSTKVSQKGIGPDRASAARPVRLLPKPCHGAAGSGSGRSSSRS